MADLFLGDIEVISARVVLPRVGVWYAELTLDTDAAPEGRQSLETDDQALALSGTPRAERTAVYGGVTELLLIGGADGLSKTLAPREYSDPTVRILLEDICRETGESLSPSADTALLSSSLTRWTRAECVAGSAVADIAAAVGCVWRILADGTLWIGRESWPTIELDDEEIINETPREASQELRVENLEPTLRPGVVWTERRVSLVEHRTNGRETSSIAWFEPTAPRVADARDRLKSGLDALIGNVTRAARYHALYPATVLGQASSGEVDVQPDSPLLPALVQVPVRSGSAGTRTQVAPGARCLIAFEGGLANGPVVVAWFGSSHEQQHTIDVPVVKLGANATRGIARQNDTVDRNAALATWMTAVETALSQLLKPVAPFTGSTVAAISSSSGRGRCD